MPEDNVEPVIDGPTIVTEHENVYQIETLVERGQEHPAGPGVTVITTYATKKKR